MLSQIIGFRSIRYRCELHKFCFRKVSEDSPPELSAEILLISVFTNFSLDKNKNIQIWPRMVFLFGNTS